MTGQHAALTAAVVDSDDPIVRYKARRYLDGADPTSAAMQRLRDGIADSPIARGLLADLDMSDPDERQGMSTIYLTFRYLADIDYPPGDDRLVPYRDHVYRWLRRLEREYDGPLYIRGTHRVHASRRPSDKLTLDLLESKLVRGEGWAVERKRFNHAAGTDSFTHARWDGVRLGRANLLLTVDALEILRTAGRW